MLLVEQNVHNALSVASRAYVFDTGRITAVATGAELLDDPDLLAAYLGGKRARLESNSASSSKGRSINSD